MKKEIEVLWTGIRVSNIDKEYYICITDIAKQKNPEFPADSIKENLIPKKLSPKEISFIYADEADILNKALFWITAKQ
jgi:hypothetical protein